MKQKLIIEAYDSFLEDGLRYNEVKPILEMLNPEADNKALQRIWSKSFRLPIGKTASNRKYAQRLQICLPVTEKDESIVSYAMIKYPKHIYVEDYVKSTSSDD